MGGRGGGVVSYSSMKNVAVVMHDRSLMAIDPCISAMPGQSTSGFTDPVDIACIKREAPRC